MKLWGGRFKEVTDAMVEQFNASIGFDHKLAEYDIKGSLAHVAMLGQCQLLSEQEVEKITQGLHVLLQKHAKGELKLRIEDEDIHMNIERLLHQEIGEVAGKLHTGRSRNDQVALDTHLYCRHYLLGLMNKLMNLNQVILQIAEQNSDVIMPGYTHLQRAEPILFAHHMMAYFQMFYRDCQRLQDSFKRINISPLGAGALAGSGVAVDNELVAESLGFDGVYDNSLDAVSDRDYIAEFLFNASLIMMHLSKFSEEIILWCSQEFSFIELDDQYCTGSSMMPQKKNPDVAELTRGKVGRVYGALMGLLTVLKGLPLAYNKDFQEDKEGLFDTVETLDTTLTVFTGMLATMKINETAMKKAVTNDYSNATQLANYLTAKGIPFREAHRITGEIVLNCIENGNYLSDVSIEQYKNYCSLIDKDIYIALDPHNVIAAHRVKGGTAKPAVMEQMQLAHQKLEVLRFFLDKTFGSCNTYTERTLFIR